MTMRISVEMFSDPNFKHRLSRYVVKLDGKPVRYCIAADEEKGEIIRYVEPLRANHLGEVIRETVRGKVQIIEKPDTEAAA